jgi:peptidoglycan hydrolase-like protein with peptidoglycan-binding domain
MEANGVSAPAAVAVKEDAPKPAPKAAPAAPKAAPKAAPAAPAGDAKIRSIQEALKARGAYPGAITGVMDDMTKGAIKAFKVANKLPADHVPGPQVMKLLGL